MKETKIPFDRIMKAQRELTTEEKETQEKFRQFLEHVRIRVTDQFVYPPEILTVDEITCHRRQFQRFGWKVQIPQDI